MKKFLLLMLFLVALGGAYLASLHFTSLCPVRNEQLPAPGPNGGFPYFIPQGVKLSPEQESALKNIDACYCLRRDKLFARIDQKRLDLAAILVHPDPDLLAVDALVNDINSLQSDLEKQTIRHILATRDLLPPEHQKRFITAITQEVKRCCDHRESPTGTP
jgi:hypothetical protein